MSEHLTRCKRCGAVVEQGKRFAEHDDFCRKRYADFTAPECQEVIVRGRRIGDGEQLDPPGDWPVVFSCKYRGAEAIGCVFLNGVVMVIPNRCSPQAGPVVFNHFGVVENNDQITAIRFDWQVTRSPRDASLRVVNQEDAQDEKETQRLESLRCSRAQAGPDPEGRGRPASRQEQGGSTPPKEA